MFNKVKYYRMVFILALFATPFVTADNIDQKDMTFIFGDIAIEQISELDQMELLSSQEMIDTKGEYGPWGAIGGFGAGVWSYGGYLAGGGSYSWSGALATVGGSTLAGAWGGPVGIARYYGLSRTSSLFGFGVGRLNSYGW